MFITSERTLSGIFYVIEAIRSKGREQMSQTEGIVIPEVFQKDIDRAVRILKEGGCSEIFLFGSGAGGKARDRSDIDLAIRGCPPGRFFHLLGRLLCELEHPVDLVSLDTENPFAHYLQKEGVLLRIG